MTLAEPRRLAELQRIARVRAMLGEAAASLPPGDWLRLVIERALAEAAAAAAPDNAPPDAKSLAAARGILIRLP